MSGLAVGLIVAIASVALTASFASVGWVFKKLGEIATNLAVLNTGASLGAREGIARLELQLTNTQKELEELQAQHYRMAESFGILAQRVNDHFYQYRRDRRQEGDERNE